MDIARCRREIAECKALLRAGHPDVEGLCLALSVWSAELRILQGANTKAAPQIGGCACANKARG
jgi:hypothetical protein